MAAAGGAVGAPSVEQVERPGVDDRECGAVQAPAELLGHARLLSYFTSGSFETIQSEVRSQVAPTTLLGVSFLGYHDQLVEIEAIAVVQKLGAA